MTTTTKTYWIVRNDDGEGLRRRLSPRRLPSPEFEWADVTVDWCYRAGSRAEAEVLAAEHGGHVVEVTVTERRVGLRWEEAPCNGTCEHWKLYDGDAFTRSINTDVDGVEWYQHDWFGEQVDAGPYTTLDAAKAAAEAAVRATWGGGAA